MALDSADVDALLDIEVLEAGFSSGVCGLNAAELLLENDSDGDAPINVEALATIGWSSGACGLIAAGRSRENILEKNFEIRDFSFFGALADCGSLRAVGATGSKDVSARAASISDDDSLDLTASESRLGAALISDDDSLDLTAPESRLDAELFSGDG